MFWTLCAVLVSASVFFGHGVTQRRATAKGSEALLQTGDLVRVSEVIDGDSLVVTDAAGATISVRILGIKAFAPKPERDPATRFGVQAAEALRELTRDEPIRVLLHSAAKDRHGRTLATLFVGDEDLGLTLVKRGLALTYTVYPVPSTPLYLAAQEEAKAAERGLWADREVAARARHLAREWSRGAE